MFIVLLQMHINILKQFCSNLDSDPKSSNLHAATDKTARLKQIAF